MRALGVPSPERRDEVAIPHLEERDRGAVGALDHRATKRPARQHRVPVRVARVVLATKPSTGVDPRTGAEVASTSRELVTDVDLPMRADYDAFIRRFVVEQG